MVMSEPYMQVFHAVHQRRRKVKPVWTSDGYILFWQKPKGNSWDDEVVKYGYMRGSETAGYVDSIISRWNSYKNKVAGGPVGSTDSSIPRPAKKPHRFKL